VDVRRLRNERQLSQQALASRLGISASYLNLIEHDQLVVSGGLQITLADVLRVDIAEAVWGGGSKSRCAKSSPIPRWPLMCRSAMPGSMHSLVMGLDKPVLLPIIVILGSRSSQLPLLSLTKANRPSLARLVTGAYVTRPGHSSPCG
jgi:transcriptional regulator with XRE-family HTH domain